MARKGAYLAGAGALALVSGLVSWPFLSFAQIAEQDGGLIIEAGVGLRFELDDGDPEFSTGFDIDILSANRTQRLSFSLDTDLTIPLDDTNDAEFFEPTYGVAYVRDTGRSRLSFGGSFTRRDVDSLRRLEDDPDTEFDENTITVTDDGSLERISLNAGLEVGLSDPIGAELRYRFNETDFSGVTDPNLEDRQFNEIAGALRFDVSRTLRLTLDAAWNQTEETDTLIPEDDTRIRAGGGFEWQAYPDLSFDGSIGYVRIETDTFFPTGATEEVNDGVNLTFGSVLDRPNGQYRVDLSRILEDPGFIYRAELIRNFDLPRGVEATARAGVVELPSGEVRAVARAAVGRETVRGDLGVSLSYDVGINNDDDEVRRTILEASYGEDLANGGRWSLSGRFTDSDFIASVEPDLTTVRLSLDYSQPLSDVWDLTAGASWQLTQEDGASDDTDNRIFVGLERRFTFRP